jgi:PAS domain S-box-containing protein
MSDQARILVVEDEFVTGLEIRVHIEEMGYEVLDVLDTGEQAVEEAARLLPDLIVMDITLQGAMTGIEAADQIRNKYRIPIVFLTAHSDDVTIQKALHSEPFGYLIKPLDERALQTTIRMALYKNAMEKALLESEKRYRGIAELSEDCIFILNRDSSVAFFNTHARKFFQIHDTGDLSDLQTLFPPGIRDKILSQAETVFVSGDYQKITHHFSWNDEVFWMDCTIVPVKTDGGVVQVIGQLHDVTAMVKLQREVEKGGLEQIEHNMEQFQVLNDMIRNPLAVIMLIASLIEGENGARIADQVRIIDDLVTKLDRGWVESSKVRDFLLKHYGHGKEID